MRSVLNNACRFFACLSDCWFLLAQIDIPQTVLWNAFLICYAIMTEYVILDIRSNEKKPLGANIVNME
ncbi:hypothetical protein K505DRAFT_9103 [Melanomma pulvis-pyrius CBS 109.77]|uniref:Uncharacterized protein n=1 Tax=Melanomma pulvis-pyrius CBS 109.77 TaxID=1314802 RepID=A0A6A6XGW7_9PLEO|nr:hypothetical protein K505DRAFT_9103 [Melanomma pulvis-pyrius CBS 109.77]